jgi:alkanesulfonate monooxygenase SsuD/methylene tetrahydromethanopterin reductase-like flavin-dependent oxidoreductase (luciferase family)
MGWRASEIQAVAREAEEAGFDAIFAAEVNNDVSQGVRTGQGRRHARTSDLHR